MNTTRFIYGHRIKLAWKQIKHDAQHITHRELTGEGFHPFPVDPILPGGYIETPIHKPT